MMNEKAKELELTNTNFVTPHGLDDPEHYTSCYELAKIADYALKNKKFSTIVNTKSCTININNTPRVIGNTNELLGILNGVDGVKTGFTNNAGRCLVTSTSRNGHQIICIVLGADTKKIRTQDSVKLIEYAFKNYEYINIKNKINEEFSKFKQKNKTKVIKGVKEKIEYKIENIDIEQIPIQKNNVKDIEVEISCKKEMQAPIIKNEIIGKIEIKVKEEIIYTRNILAQEEIKKKNIIEYIKQLTNNYSSYLIQGLK